MKWQCKVYALDVANDSKEEVGQTTVEALSFTVARDIALRELWIKEADTGECVGHCFARPILDGALVKFRFSSPTHVRLDFEDDGTWNVDEVNVDDSAGLDDIEIYGLFDANGDGITLDATEAERSDLELRIKERAEDCEWPSWEFGF